MIHWAIAAPFVVCYLSACILVFIYNPDPQRPYRIVFSWIHRLAGVCLITLPPLALLLNLKDWRLHLKNIRAAWLWTVGDVKWLLLMGAAALSRRIQLPEAGKFNAAEKLNFMIVMTTSPLFIVSGVLIWLPQVDAFLPWMAHLILAGLVTPFLLGHIFMATINPSTRVGLRGMVSGYVSRRWASHHYPKWYRATFGGSSAEPSDAARQTGPQDSRDEGHE